MGDTAFESFPKIPRLTRECVITEKIDGTNAQVYIGDDLTDVRFGSRNRWITPEDDNYGFARWATEHIDELRTLGPGRHFGEWWGSGIQRGYGLKEKRFTLFNVGRWENETLPACVSLVPVLYRGEFNEPGIESSIGLLRFGGSIAAPGFMDPEGIVIYHTQSKTLFKKTLNGDETYKTNGACA
jgi:hypothetical protein